MEADVIESGVVQAILVLLHLGLHAADAAVGALVAPVAVLAPLSARALQRRVAAAAELDVVDGRVVTKQALVRLHAELEGGQCAGGAVHGLGPLTETAEREKEGLGPALRTLWSENTPEHLVRILQHHLMHDGQWQDELADAHFTLLVICVFIHFI